MKRDRMWLIALMMIMVTSPTPPSFAKDNNRLLTNWELTPDSNRPHAVQRQLALRVPDGTTAVYCGFLYSHGRYQFDTGPAGQDPVPLALKNGGRITVALEILRGEETIKVGKKKIKAKMGDRRREAKVGWSDSSGVAEEDFYIQGWPATMHFETSTALPVQLKKGDVLLFSLKFKKMPKLEGVEWTGPVVKWDSLFASAGCKTCGTTDHPCPEL